MKLNQKFNEILLTKNLKKIDASFKKLNEIFDVTFEFISIFEFFKRKSTIDM